MDNLYADIAARTGGNIYIGVVGPVRTGKSTLIKRIMELLVIPNISDPYRAQRARDELPQSGSGKTVMTSEPKFVPEEAVEISPDGAIRLRIRMIDTVGYMVEGAVGVEEDGQPRMVATPWYDHEIPLTQAAELGTKKVMEEHCSIGLVVTTDGSITDIRREDYVQAEDRAIRDMRATGKPFLVIVNSQDPKGKEATAVCRRIFSQHGIHAAAADCQALDTAQLGSLLEQLLYAFPMQELRVSLPRWMDALEWSHPTKAPIVQALRERCEAITALGEAEAALLSLTEIESIREVSVSGVDLARGCVSCALRFPDSLFYQILSSRTGLPIENDAQLMEILTQLSGIKREYDRIADAMACVNATGYGIVMPGAREMKLEPPEVVKKNGAYGIRLKAGAPSIHMIRVDIDTQISPMVGDEQQSRELIACLEGEDPEKLWQSNIFGKSVYDLLQEGLAAKLVRMPEEVRSKFRGTLGRIVNEGATGLICLIL